MDLSINESDVSKYSEDKELFSREQCSKENNSELINIISNDTIFQKNVQIDHNLLVNNSVGIKSLNVENDLNSNNLNTFGLNILHGNTVSNGDIYISKNNDTDYTNLKSDGTITTKKITVNDTTNKSALNNSKIYVNSISLNRVINSISTYYQSIQYVQYISNLIIQNQEEIKIKGFPDVLHPLIENTYLQTNDYYYIASINNDISNRIEIDDYNEYPKYIGLSVNQIVASPKPIYFVYEGDNFIEETKKINNAFEKFKSIGFNEVNYSLIIKNWEYTVNLDFGCFINIENIYPNSSGSEQNYVYVGSKIDLSKIIQNVTELYLFSPEYINFTEVISERMYDIHYLYNQIKLNVYPNISNYSYSVWDFNTSNTSLSRCLYSNKFSDWIGNIVENIVILGSYYNINYILNFVIGQISGNFRPNFDGQVVILENTYQDLNYVYVCKLISINDSLKLILIIISVDQYFNKAISTNGDVSIEGSLSVNNYDNTNFVNIFSETKSLEVFGNVGIHKQTPTSSLDIEGISVSEIDEISTKMISLNYSIYDFFNYYNTNYSSDKIKDWNTIFNNYPGISIDKAVITVKISFKDFENNSQYYLSNFNNYIEYSHLEEKYSKWNGFNANNVLIGYLNPYLDYINYWYTILYQNKDYFLLMGKQTFTQICNYFDGQLLKMHIATYDTINEQVLFFSAHIDLNYYLLDPFKNSLLVNYFNQLFACEQVINILSALLKDPVNQEKLYNNRLFLSEWLNSSPFKDRFGYPLTGYFSFRVLPVEEAGNCIYLCGEDIVSNTLVQTNWINQYPKNLGIPNSDLIVSNVISKELEYLYFNFNLYELDRLFFFYTYWSLSYKFSYVQYFQINGITYLIGSGIQLSYIIPNSITSKGDNLLNGSLIVNESVTSTPIFKIDETNKKSSIFYPLGLGTEDPESLLEINDLSITNLSYFMGQLSTISRYVNDIKQLIKNAPLDKYTYIIENYIDPFTGLKIDQTVLTYFIEMNYNNNIIDVNDYELNYYWYIPSWENIPLGNINDPINIIQLNEALLAFNKEVNTLYFYNNFASTSIYDFTWGKKISIRNLFNNINGTLSSIGCGVNFNNYFLKNTTDNIQNIASSIGAINLFLDILYGNYIGVSPLNNYILTNYVTNLRKIYNKYQLLVITYADSYVNARIFLGPDGYLPKNLDNLIETDTLVNMIYNNGFKGNLTFEEVMILKQKIVNIYQKLNLYYGSSTQLNLEDTGYINYRTDDSYWINIWKWIQLKTGQFVIASYNYNVLDYLKPSIQMLGDFKMAGNLTLMNPVDYLKYYKGEVNLSEINVLLSMYPDEQFIGLGSQKIYTQYMLNYKTIDLIANTIYAKNHVVVSNPYYPNLVCERIVESPDPEIEATYVSDSFSSCSMRRTSNIYSIEEMVEKGKGKYGFDISFEVQDKYDMTYEMGHFGIRLNEIKQFDNGIKYPIGEFYIDIVDNNNIVNSSHVKTILTIDKDSRLYVDKIRLGTKDLYASIDENGEEVLKWGDKTIVLK
jgi:hypothetical protein